MKRVTITSLFLMGIMLNALSQSQGLSLKNVKSNDITFDDIQYWIGSGENRCLLIVNWCDPEIAFAWGYRFASDTVSVSQVLADIALADSRFTYVDGGGYITEITYHDSDYLLSLKGDYWMYNINEGAVMGIATQKVETDDFIEFGDESCGISDTDWVYVWDIPVTSVSNPVGDTNHITPINNNIYDAMLYPNPASDFVVCELKGWNEKVELSVVDMNGKIIYSNTVDCKETTICKLPCTDFQKGMYFLHIASKAARSTKKLMLY